MQLYELESPHLDTTVISYIDDGTVVTQSTNLDTNYVILKVAYAIFFRLFMASGLALEHNKTELYHFMHERSDAMLGRKPGRPSSLMHGISLQQ